MSDYWVACGRRCEGMGIGEWIAAGGCGVGWKERCDENVLIALACRGQTYIRHCIGILVDVWKCSVWFPVHIVSVGGV